MYGTDNGFVMWPQEQTQVLDNNSYKCCYIWNERDQLVRTEDRSAVLNYTYGADGNRASKYTTETETLYFNNFWTWHYDTANEYYEEGQYSKNIYLGETRIVTRLLTEETNSVLEPERTYYYHTDHLGSASLVTNPNGEIYERLEYTPYGEVWVDICEETGLLYLPYKFSAKERDSETGLYYYGARYLDPKYSLWKSADPALGEYIPVASTNDEWSKKNSNLPGMGGIFNPTNFHLYHYAGNNPIRYTDPDGRTIYIWMNELISQALTYLYENSETFKKEYDKLLQQTNVLNQKFVVLFIASENEKYPGNTVTNDSPILSDILVEGKNKDGNIIIYEEQKTDEAIQGIFIILDFKQISEKKLDLYRILAEEVCHAADCISYGAEKWNAKCGAEDKYFGYYERPREVKAKELTEIILQELQNEE